MDAIIRDVSLTNPDKESLIRSDARGELMDIQQSIKKKLSPIRQRETVR